MARGFVSVDGTLRSLCEIGENKKIEKLENRCEYQAHIDFPEDSHLNHGTFFVLHWQKKMQACTGKIHQA